MKLPQRIANGNRIIFLLRNLVAIIGRTMANEAAEENNYPQRLAHFSFVVTSEEDRDSDRREGSHLYRYAVEVEDRLYSAVQRKVRETLGEDYRIEDFELTEGSLIVSFAIAADTFFKSPVGQFVLNFSRYEALMKSINLIVSQISSLLDRFFSRSTPSGQIQVSGIGQPSAAVMSIAKDPPKPPMVFDANLLLLSYLILSHAILLVVVLWLVVHHLK